MSTPTPPDHTDRARWMGILARAPAARLAALMPDLPPHTLLRGPDIGSVMIRGRIGGTGGPFNLGEMTVTRASIRLPDGTVGHAHVQGRDKGHALRAALADALLQGPDPSATRALIATLATEEATRRSAAAARAAQTRVEFFTLARGEDA